MSKTGAIRRYAKLALSLTMGFSLDNVKKLATEQPVGLAACSVAVALCLVLLFYVWRSRRGERSESSKSAEPIAESKVECAV